MQLLPRGNARVSRLSSSVLAKRFWARPRSGGRTQWRRFLVANLVWDLMQQSVKARRERHYGIPSGTEGRGAVGRKGLVSAVGPER